MNARTLSLVGVLVLLLQPAKADPRIISIEEIRAFEQNLAPRTTALSVTGSVLHVGFSDKHAHIILSDGTGLRAELYRFPNLEQPTPGDTIRASGHAYMGKSHESLCTIEGDFEVLEHGPRPEPLPIRLSEINTEVHHLMTIRTEGTVISAINDETDNRFMILLLKDEGTVVPVTIPLDRFGDLSNLVDARIRVAGVYRRSVSGIRKVSWPNIQPFDPEAIEVLTPPPADPFKVPTLGQQLYFSTDEVLRMSKRSVLGEVLATWAGNRIMLRTEDGRIVNVRLENEEDLPACGASIVAAGMPETDLFRINLTAARWRPAGSRSLPPAADDEEPISTIAVFWNNNGRKSINGEIHGKLLSVTGIIRALPSPDDEAEKRFILDADGTQIPVDVTSCPALLDGLEIGSRVQVTGRCLLLTETWRQGNVFPQAKGFALVVRSARDIVTLSSPSWWTPGKLLILIAILILTLAGVETWNLIQRHLAKLKIVERTRLAVELHDSLSQNLAGVAFQVAAGKNAIADNPEAAKARIQASERMLQSCRTELRQCLFDLRSDMLEETDFAAAIRKALSQLKDATAVSIRFNARRSDFPDPDAHAILSVIRELTANAIRHGHAASVRIAGSVENGNLLFSVTDNGCGFDPQNCAGMAEGHFGLSGVRDRLKRLQGTITFTSKPGKGAKATVKLPIPKS